MSVAGLKKQFNKVNQYMSEKIGGAKGTELDDEFTQMEMQIDVMGRLVDELMARTHELLQPNPASRAKLSAVKSISKMRGQSNAMLYPQPEGQLGECMIKHGKDLGEDSLFGAALTESGETYRTLADVKYSLEDNVKQNFIEPLQHIQTKDLKEVNHHRKKMSGRRLDYDCKRRKREKGSAVTDEELQAAEEKFEESKSLAETAMFNLMDNDVEQISALAAFIEAEANFHRQSADALEALSANLQERVQDAANRPRKEHVPKRVASTLNLDKSPGYNDHNDYTSNSLSAPSYSSYGSSKEDVNSTRDVYGRDEPDYNQQYESPKADSMSTNNTNAAPSKTDAYDPFGAWDMGTASYQTASTGSASYHAANTGMGSYQSANSGMGSYQAAKTGMDSYKAASSGSASYQAANTPMSFSDPIYSTVDYSAKKSQKASGGMEKPPPYRAAVGQQPCAKALYDFDPENEGELGFKEGDVINLIERIDENWYEGSVHGQTGFFPVNYVEVIVNL